eukprot:scaffold541_cov138-Cylindrotheca_fusiformis.AAC.15
MQNSSQVRKTPFIYPEYLAQVKSKMSHSHSSEEQGPILSAMSNHNRMLFPSFQENIPYANSSRSTCGRIGNADSCDTETTAALTIESSSNMTSPAAICIPSQPQHHQHPRIVAVSVQHEAQQTTTQPLFFTTTGSMYRNMFSSHRMPNLVPTTISSNFSNFLSKKVISSPASSKQEAQDAAPLSMISPSRFLSVPEVSPIRKVTPSSPRSISSSSPPSPPPSPCRSTSMSPRSLFNHLKLQHCSNSNNDPTSNVSVSSSNSAALIQARIEAPKIRARVKNMAQGLAKNRKNKKCASCLCRDQKLAEQRKEIDHLKEIVKDLLVLSLEAKKNAENDDDDSLEDLPDINESSILPANGDLLKVSELALDPVPRSFEEDPQDPLNRTETISSSPAMIQMSHSLRIKQSFTRGPPTKKPEKLRHLRIQVRGQWGYYSGPVPEKDVPLVGCVVRFDNGDLYVGNMKNSCLDGPGSYHPKDPGQPVLRGNFVDNELSP